MELNWKVKSVKTTKEENILVPSSYESIFKGMKSIVFFLEYLRAYPETLEQN